MRKGNASIPARFYVVHFDEDANDALYRLRLSTVSFE